MAYERFGSGKRVDVRLNAEVPSEYGEPGGSWDITRALPTVRWCPSER